MQPASKPQVAERTTFGAVLRKYRHATSTTQAELATRAGYSTVYIGMLERGERNPPPDTVNNLAKVLELVDADLMEFCQAGGIETSLRLPATNSSFIGRRREQAVLAERLQDPDIQLVSLIGPGGVGKTRLAIETARQLHGAFVDGVTFVALERVGRWQSVPTAIANALGLKPSPSRPTRVMLLEYLADKKLLLILDNLEHLRPARLFLEELMDRAPGVRLLVTSRIRLELATESVLEVHPLLGPLKANASVPPLLLPTPGGPMPVGGGGDSELVGSVAESDAAQLFLDRARMVDPSFRLTRVNAADIADLCTVLDGLPLALELAAARVSGRRLPDVIKELSRPDRTRGLFRDLEQDRHESLNATFYWSFELLDPSSRTAFAALSVFAGSFSLETARSLASPLDEEYSEAVIEGLVAASFLRTVPTARGERFSMLQPVREFGRDQLKRLGKEKAAWESLLALCNRIGEQYSAAVGDPGAEAWIRQLVEEYDNIVAALEWSINNSPLEGLKLAGAINILFEYQSQVREGSRLINALLEAGQRELSSRQQTDDERDLLAKGMTSMSAAAWVTGDEARAVETANEAVRLYRTSVDRMGLARALLQSGNVEMLRGDPEAAVERYREALQVRSEAQGGDPPPNMINNLGVATIATGRYEEAADLFQQTVDYSIERGDRRSEARARDNLGFAVFHLGDTDRAASLARQALVVMHEYQDVRGVADCLELIAATAERKGDSGRAAYLLGGAQALRTGAGMVHGQTWLEAFVQGIIQRTTDSLGEEAFGTAFEAGKEGSLDSVVSVALE